MLGRRPSQLRLRRLALGLRIRDVANACGLADARVSEIERGDGRNPDAVELALIEATLRKNEAADESTAPAQSPPDRRGLA
ncbi:MAG: helix-turn-helix domain-containing protein [Deltaproteobacteria bacterium]|nr:helix-turn-helix domain-containing protein [Deltaproteobacteria bacterium]